MNGLISYDIEFCPNGTSTQNVQPQGLTVTPINGQNVPCTYNSPINLGAAQPQPITNYCAQLTNNIPSLCPTIGQTNPTIEFTPSEQANLHFLQNASLNGPCNYGGSDYPTNDTTQVVVRCSYPNSLFTQKDNVESFMSAVPGCFNIPNGQNFIPGYNPNVNTDNFNQALYGVNGVLQTYCSTAVTGTENCLHGDSTCSNFNSVAGTNICSTWVNQPQYSTAWSNAMTSYCALHPSSDECGCLSAKNQSQSTSTTYNQIKTLAPAVPDSCWFTPCRPGNNVYPYLITQSYVNELAYCPKDLCVNIQNVINYGKININSIKQDIQCTFTTLDEPTETTDSSSIWIWIIVGIIIFIIIVLVIYFLVVRHRNKI